MTQRDAILEHLVDLKTGTIPLMGPVDEQMYAQVVRCLMAFQNSGVHHDKLTFILNTYGGDLYQAMAIYDLIRMQPMKTVVQCNGPVMSAGTIILQAGDIRLMTKRSYLMFHFGNQSADTNQCLAHFNEISKDMREIYKTRSKVSPRIINSWFSMDTYYNATEALKHGLVDRVVEYEEEANES